MGTRCRAADPIAGASTACPLLTGLPLSRLALLRYPRARLGAEADRPAQARVPGGRHVKPLLRSATPGPQHRIDHRPGLPARRNLGCDDTVPWHRRRRGLGHSSAHRQHDSRACGILEGVQPNQALTSAGSVPAIDSERTSPQPPSQSARWRVPGSDSIWWLVAVAAAFTGAQLLFVRVHGLSWDEVVYASQVTRHIPAAPFDPARSRGIPLLVAPLALLTSSVTALRGYLAVASGAGLFCSLLAWRRLRPAWVLAIGGLSFAGLWVAQFYGPQAMPDEWMAFAALAAAGLFLRAVAAPGSRWLLGGLGAAIAAAALIRIGDAIFLAAVLGLAALAVRPWRQLPVLATIAGGLIIGAAEWVGEAYARFGGPIQRLHKASAEQGGFGLRLGAWAELRAVNGPTLCRPCTVGWHYPALSLWWLALPLVVVLGVLGARQAGRLSSSVLAACCGAGLAAQYLVGIGYAAPRFLLPAYALAAIPVADLIAWIMSRTTEARRAIVGATIGLVLLGQLAAQHVVLTRQVADAAALHDDYAKVAADLRRLGISGHCLINGAQAIPIAFYAACASAPGLSGTEPRIAASGRDRYAVLEWARSRPPSYAKTWPRHALPGGGLLTLTAYLPPGPHRRESG